MSQVGTSGHAGVHSREKPCNRHIRYPILLSTLKQRLQISISTYGRQKRIKRLEELRAAQEKLKELDKFLHSEEHRSERRRTTSDSDSSHKKSPKAIKVKNLMKFTSAINHRRRQKWIYNLNRTFAGDPYRFASNCHRVLFTLLLFMT